MDKLTDEDYLAVGLNPPAPAKEKTVASKIATRAQETIRRNSTLAIFVLGILLGFVLHGLARLF